MFFLEESIRSIAGKPPVWWQRVLLFILAALLPFSVEVGLSPRDMVNIPSEPLIGIGLLLLLWDIGKSSRIWYHIFRKELIWVFPFMLAYILTTLFSVNLMVSVKSSVVNITYILVFYALMIRVLMDKPSHFQAMMGFYALGLFVVFVIAIIRMAEYDWNILVVRALYHPFYKDHTLFGATAAMMTAYFLTSRKRSQWLLGLVFLLAVFFSTSRGAILSLGVFAYTLVMMNSKFKKGFLVFAVMLFLIMSAVFVHVINDRLSAPAIIGHEYADQSKGRTIVPNEIIPDVSSAERTNRWIAAWRMFFERPVTGFGPGTYQFVYIPYQDSAFFNRLTVSDISNIPEGSGGTAHSQYLLLASEMGLVGLLAFLLILGRWVFLAIKCSKKLYANKHILIAIASLSTYLFHGFFNNFLTTDKFAFLFWGMGAFLVAGKGMKSSIVND